MRRTIFLAFTIAFLAALATSCGGIRTHRISGDEVRDVGTDWNDSDSEEMTKNLVPQIVTGGWIDEFTKNNPGKKPRIKVGSVIVRAGGDIVKTEVLTNRITAALLQTGRVKASQPRGEEWQTVKELEHQDIHATAETRKKAFAQLASDYLLTGDLNSEDQRGRGEMVRAYTVTLKLIDIQTADIVWMGIHKLKKHIQH